MSDFGDAIDTDWRADGADSNVGVQHHVLDVVKAARVVSSQRRQPRSTDSWDPYLPPVRVAGELKIDWRERGFVGKIRFVGEKNNRFASRNFFDGQAQIRLALKRVVNSCKPEARPITLDGHAGIFQ